MEVCLYYQAHVKKQENIYFVGILKSYDHLCFDRTLDAKGAPDATIFEFFVPPLHETFFLTLMDYFKKQGTVTNLIKVPNRLLNPSEKF